MAQELSILEGNAQLPAYLQGADTGVTSKLLAGMFTGGNRIGLRGSRFRLVVNGIEEGVIEENYLDTILLSAAPAVSRVYYKDAYKQGENVPPTCYSADGIAPPLDVPQRQSDKCATCPQNVKGSKVDGGQKYKACGYFRRLVLMLAGDTEDRRVFKLDVKSQGLFGESNSVAKSLNDYIKALETRGVDAGQVVTRITFDVDASVPKLLFRPQRYISEEEFRAVAEMVASEEVTSMAEVHMGTLDLSNEESSDAAEAGAEEAPAESPPQAAAPARQTPAPARTQQAATQQARPQGATPQATQRPKPAAAQQARPAAAQTAKPAPARAQPVVETVPATATAEPVQQIMGDDELDSILEGLE